MRTAGIALAVALWAQPLAAAELFVHSRIHSVVVFPRGAEVTRVAKLKIEQGDHELVLRDLPAQTITRSLRVDARGTGRLVIGSVDTRRLQIPRTDPAASQSERRRLEQAIEQARDERDVVLADVQAAELQKSFVEKLSELPTRPVPQQGTTVAGQPDWNGLFTMIGGRMVEAQKAVLSARLKQRTIDRRIADLEKALAALAPNPEQRTEARVFVTAPAPIEVELSVIYQVSDASWRSIYDARLASGARNAPPKLTIVRRAAIEQRTGEDWRGVALTLSTTRPAGGASAPALHPVSVDYAPDVVSRPVAMAPATEAARRLREAESARKVADADRRIASEERGATRLAGEFQAVFAVEGRQTVLATGETKRVQIDSVDLEPSLVVRAVPKLNAQAFLYAKITTPKGSPYLPGAISLFRDGTFVGSGHLPMLSPGIDHELGFGADDSVRVRHAIVEEKRGETGLISASKTDTRSYRISVRNLHERAISVVVLDQIPNSRQQDIKVELTGKTPPSRRDVDDQRGVLAWEAKLEPDEERQIEFGYRVTWPGGKRIHYGR